MKKILTPICVLAFSFSVFAQPFNLGKVSFATEQTWTIGSQTWSDAVQAENCSNKTTFNGRSSNYIDYLVDCRSNPNQKGDLFSWQAVYELRNELCPAPWRVPTLQDFIDLDIALGGTGEYQNYNPEHRDKYLNVWGGTYGGGVDGDENHLRGQGSSASYWSQSQYANFSSVMGHYLHFYATKYVYGRPIDYVDPQMPALKHSGFSLRCVRDKK